MDRPSSEEEDIGLKVTHYIMNGGRIKIKDVLKNVVEEVYSFSRIPCFLFAERCAESFFVNKVEKKLNFSEAQPKIKQKKKSGEIFMKNSSLIKI